MFRTPRAPHFSVYLNEKRSILRFRFVDSYPHQGLWLPRSPSVLTRTFDLSTLSTRRFLFDATVPLFNIAVPLVTIATPLVLGLHNLVDHIAVVVVHCHHTTPASSPSSLLWLPSSTSSSHVFPLVGECSAVGLLHYCHSCFHLLSPSYCLCFCSCFLIIVLSFASFSLLPCLWLLAAIFASAFFCFLLSCCHCSCLLSPFAIIVFSFLLLSVSCLFAFLLSFSFSLVNVSLLSYCCLFALV